MKVTLPIQALGTLLLSATFPVVLGIPEASDLIITEVQQFENAHYAFDRLIINTGAQAFFWHTKELSTSYEFDNAGQYYQTDKSNSIAASSDEAAISSFDSRFRFLNSGTFIFDYAHSKQAPKFALKSPQVINIGEMWFEIGGPKRKHRKHFDTFPRLEGNTDVSIVTSKFFQNKGHILVAGTESHLAKLEILLIRKIEEERRAPGMWNEGHIQLKYVIWVVEQLINGWGCISLGDGAYLVLKDDIDNPNMQTIYMDPQSSKATFGIYVTDRATSFKQELVGFEENCFIHFSTFMKAFEYAGDTLRFSQDGEFYLHQIIIGYGYSKEYFKFDGLKLTYSERVIKSRPIKCATKNLKL